MTAQDAEDALARLCADLGREIGWAKAAEIRLSLEGPSAALSAGLTGPQAAEGDQPAPAPGLCADPLCDHLTLRCPRNRTHLVGGHAGNRSAFISKGATQPPQGSNQPRGRRGR
jgi:hypothetical protein